MNHNQDALVILGGGVAHGLSHIGALNVIERHYNIKGIIGTSMGALIGGLYVSGYNPNSIYKLFSSFTALDYLSFVKLALKPGCLLDNSRLMKQLRKILNEIRIEECKIPFVAVSFDVVKKATVLINEGDLVSALLASSAIPFIFEPFEYNDYVLVDGGVEFPLPIDFCHLFPEDLVKIAVNVLPEVPDDPVMLSIGNPGKTDKIENHTFTALKTTLYNQAFLATQSVLKHQPDIYVSAHSNSLKAWDFVEVKKFFELGRSKTEEAINSFENDNQPFTKEMISKYDTLMEHLKKIDKLKIFS